ncbi:hypothetical protein Scep_024631 [Stephania cephalantha]|uniref:Senescence domain-containing protein n=1 Tax=Stephania cephalantha TaxID=152367 RepID=A0AAP0EY59_9MAGN
MVMNKQALREWAWCHFQDGKPIADALDKEVKEASNIDEMNMVFKIGIICTGTLPSTRPSMKEVLQILQYCSCPSRDGQDGVAEKMSCFCGRRKNSSSSDIVSTEITASTMAERDVRKAKEEVLLRIPSCAVHLMEEGETIELANGDFTLVRLSDDNVFLANIVKVGEDVQWPLAKDEPVLKLDAVHYLFSLPMKEGGLMSYGVSFSGPFRRDDMSLVDSFLKEHSCFSDVGSSSASSKEKPPVEWKSYAPRIEEYNGFLAKAIAAGTGQIVKWIFKCTNAYTKQVQKGGEMIITGVNEQQKYSSTKGTTEMKVVRKLSKMTEKMSKSVLTGIEVATGSIVTPVFQSKAGKAILSTVPGEALLASLEAINKVLDAAEVAEKRAFSATSNATSRAVSKRFGENAGEATEDILATAGHCAGTAWNIFKIRKALTPKSSVSSAVVRNAAKTKM